MPELKKKNAPETPPLAEGVWATAAESAHQSSAKLSLNRSPVPATRDQALWAAIKNRTEAIGFKRYSEFLKRVFCGKGDPDLKQEELKRLTPLKGAVYLHGVNAYQELKAATECFLILECGVAVKASKDPATGEPIRTEFVGMEDGRFDSLPEDHLSDYLTKHLSAEALPYLAKIAQNLSLETEQDDAYSPLCVSARVPHARLLPCLLELIWSYWHEEGMLVQTINAVSLRFQNKRRPGLKDPLAQLALDPLRPMANLLWGYIQDEPHRLTIRRRAYEYSHEYGLSLVGKAAPKAAPVETRSKFLEAFHSLLHRTWTFYQEDADTTVISEGFPLLNALKEVHMLLAEGAHNQFGDLPWTARVEMLIQEWLLSRPEIQDFLRGRAMVPYREAWMGQVDNMKKLQGWTDTSVTHFRDLGVFGEQILLSIRYGDWTEVESQDNAKNWARYWKPEIQSYIHAYRAATGVDLTNPDRVDSELPAVHLRARLARHTRTG